MKAQKLNPQTSALPRHQSATKAPKFERILVPTDFSPLSRLGLDAALVLLGRNPAESPDATVELLHVIEPVSVMGAADFSSPAHFIPEVATEQAEEEFTNLKTAYQNIKNINTRVATGHPARTVCARAREGNFDLIVLSSHGRTGMGRILMGSVAEQIVQNSECPVLVVKPLKDSQGELLPEARELSLNHILVGYDHRPGAERALEMAEGIAHPTDSRITLLRALPPQDVRIGLNLLHDQELDDSLQSEALAKLADLRMAHLPKSAGWELRAFIGHPWDVIADYAREHSCDLVVVGPHEHTRWGRGIMGSTAQRVVRLAPCAVLAVK